MSGHENAPLGASPELVKAVTQLRGEAAGAGADELAKELHAILLHVVFGDRRRGAELEPAGAP